MKRSICLILLSLLCVSVFAQKKKDALVLYQHKNYKEAIELLQMHRFDLALVDISLPDGNGFTVCTQIKETQEQETFKACNEFVLFILLIELFLFSFQDTFHTK